MRGGPGPGLRLEARGIEKCFPGVRALHAVDLGVAPGDVLGLVGENGAGKSTLMKVLAGLVHPDAGQLYLEGRPVVIDSPRRAAALGIALIHQEQSLAEGLDVGANLFLGREPRRLGFLRRAELERAAHPLLERVGADFGPRRRVGSLSVGRRQLVEIARALALEASVLIMDEPTACLSGREAERLFEVIRDLRAEGVSVVYISHRLAELTHLADRVVVLRDGENAGELGPGAITREAMIGLMLGRALSERRSPARAAARGGEPALEARGLLIPGRPEHPLSFRLHPGERVGLAGLVGAGRSELLRVLFGLEPAAGGRLAVGGRDVNFRHPREAVRAGLGLVPEDRQAQGLFLDLTLRANVSAASLGRLQRGGFVRRAEEDRLVGALVERLAIRAAGLEQPVRFLSGGNQQKAVVARWLALEPRVLLFDEPTRGIDVGSRQEIYALMDELAERGVAVLFATSDMEELLQQADRVLVMHEGRIAGELAGAELGEEAVLQLATGRSAEVPA